MAGNWFVAFPCPLALGSALSGALGHAALAPCRPARDAGFSRARSGPSARCALARNWSGPAGAPSELRAPLPHVTLACLEREASKAQRQAALQWARELDLRRVAAVLGRPVSYGSADAGPTRYRIVSGAKQP